LVNRYLNPYINQIKSFPEFVFSGEACLDAVKFFKTPLFLDIGCGNGESLVFEAQKNPDKFYVGVELQYKEVYRTGLKIQKAGLKNCLVLQMDAKKLPDLFKSDQISSVNIFFPDPWPKTKHRKNRLVQVAYLRRLFAKMQKGASVNIRTDNDDYFIHIVSTVYSMKDEFKLSITEFTRDYYRDGARKDSCITAFERIFLRQGLLINALSFIVE